MKSQYEPIFVDLAVVAKILDASVELLFDSAFVKVSADDDADVSGLKQIIKRELVCQMGGARNVREVVRRTFLSAGVVAQWCSQWVDPQKFDVSAYPGAETFDHNGVVNLIMCGCQDFIDTICKTVWGESGYRWVRFDTPVSKTTTQDTGVEQARRKLWEMMEAAFNDNLVVAANKQSGVFLNLLLDVFEETPCYDNTSIEWFVDKVLATGQSTIKDRVMENLSFDDIMRVMNHSETNVTRWRKYYIRYIADKVPSTEALSWAVIDMVIAEVRRVLFRNLSSWYQFIPDGGMTFGELSDLIVTEDY